MSRLRAVLGRRRLATDSGQYEAYVRTVEPELAAVPRVHRFAKPPVIGESVLPAASLAVWIEEPEHPGNPELLARTRASLDQSTVAASEVLSGPLGVALDRTRADRVLLVRSGDELAPLALERLGQAASLAPDAHVITCDEDRLTARRCRSDPHVRPGPSPDRWLACDDSGAMVLVSREATHAALSDITAGEGWRHELALRLAGGAGECHAHVPMVLCHRAGGARDSVALDPDVVTRTLHRFGQPGRALAWREGCRRIERPVVGEPRVEVIVCFRDRPELLERCVASLLSATDYERLGLALVDNGSRAPETAELVRRLVSDHRIRTLQDDRPFNFAALNNLAARTSTADVLVFLNNDTEVIEEAWLGTLLQEALRPEVGAVAPMLLYPGGEVQHAGAALGLHGYAGHPFAGLAPGENTPFGRADGGTRNWMAVTAACLMVERAKFDAVNGFDETFVVAGNDVDLCLRLTAAGHRSLCVPHAVLLHDESRSRGAYIDPGDFLTSERRYGTFRTVGDPFYNPNLTLQATTCAMRTPGEGGA